MTRNLLTMYLFYKRKLLYQLFQFKKNSDYCYDYGQQSLEKIKCNWEYGQNGSTNSNQNLSLKRFQELIKIYQKILVLKKIDLKALVKEKNIILLQK